MVSTDEFFEVWRHSCILLLVNYSQMLKCIGFDREIELSVYTFYSDDQSSNPT